MRGMRALIPALLLFCLSAQAQSPLPASRPDLRTVPERTNFTMTSTHADVLAFLEAVHGPRIVVRKFGTSQEGKPMPVAIVSDPPCDPDGIVLDRRIRVLIVANIHGGEVEGKEAAQMLLAEFARGEHSDWLEQMVFLVVPDFNPDGNDKISKKNRVEQNGPEEGVGRRENGAGLDLNRDFVKLESPEAQALVGLMNRFDPHALLDLHTTNGSYHGYHVTYATSQSPNVSAPVAKLGDEKWVPALVQRLAKNHGLRAFPYGNLERGAQQQAWASFDHRARFLTNYYGLRNRLALLCEAYSYLSFEKRIAVTRAFVTEAMSTLLELRNEVRELPAQPARARFGHATELGQGELGEVLMGEVERVRIEGLGTRLVAKDVAKPTQVRVRTTFVAKAELDVPAHYAVVAPSAATIATLLRHGIPVSEMQQDEVIEGEAFFPTAIEKARSSFQKHMTLTMKGRVESRVLALPKGTLVIPGSCPLAATLLDPMSEDSLGTWNHFEAASRVAPEGEDSQSAILPYPVVRLRKVALAKVAPLAREDSIAGSDFPTRKPVLLAVHIRSSGAGQVVYEVGPTRSADLAQLESVLTKHFEEAAMPRCGCEVRAFGVAAAAQVGAVRELCARVKCPAERVLLD